VAQRLSTEDAAELDVIYPERMTSYHELCERFKEASSTSDRTLNCGAGRSSLDITPDGNVMPCAMLQQSGFSVREHSVKDIWNRNFLAIVNRRRQGGKKCDTCNIQSACSNCAGWSFIESGDYEKEVEYMCDIARKRAERFTFMPDIKDSN
jgi:radical SAM protein with 4Fe4S-binding SPASM domain